jgi:isoleucyl-tRNA synthetase
VFTADEAWSYRTESKDLGEDAVHLQDWPGIPVEWLESANSVAVDAVIALRAPVNERLEALRKDGAIGKGLDATVSFSGDAAGVEIRALAGLGEWLPEMFIVSQVIVTPAPGAAFAIEAQPCESLGLVRCPRCWRWVEKLHTTEMGVTCPRCVQALETPNR